MTEKIFSAVLPPVPRNSDRQTLQFNAAVKQALDELKKQLVISERGIVSKSGSRASAGDVVDPDTITLPEQTFGTPSAPTNLQANGAIENIVLSWDYSGNEVEYFEIWRADSDSFGLATLRAITQGTVYADTIGAGNSKYYWVRGVADGEVFGPFNDTSGTLGQTARDPVDVLAEVSEGIKQSALAQSLLDGIPDLAGLPDEILARVQGDADEAAARQAAIAEVETDVQTVASDLEAETQTRTSQISSLNNSVSAIQSTVNTVASDLEAETQARTTAISQLGDDFAAADVSLQTQVDSLNNDLSSEYTVKLDVNGKISGFGLFNDGQTSDFQVLSDRFAIVNQNNSGDIITPFVVSNGDVVMDNAYIVDLTASNIAAGSITADQIQAGTITADDD